MHLWGDENALIRVIPNGVDLATFWKLEPESDALVQRLQLTEANPLLLLPVRLTPRKNIELALHVLAELRKDNPAAELLITGPEGAHNPSNAEYKRKLLELRDNLQLNGLAHFLAEVTTSPVPDSVVSDLYRIADALLITSRDEGFGIPIVEAGVNRLPIFCPDIPALRELGDEDVNYFDPAAKPAEIASCLNRRLKDNATSRWSRRARHAYAWEQIYRSQIDPLIRQVAA
jgi:glycosyltransferase involved in cell wall biosynthesis